MDALGIHQRRVAIRGERRQNIAAAGEVNDADAARQRRDEPPRQILLHGESGRRQVVGQHRVGGIQDEDGLEAGRVLLLVIGSVVAQHGKAERRDPDRQPDATKDGEDGRRLADQKPDHPLIGEPLPLATRPPDRRPAECEDQQYRQGHESRLHACNTRSPRVAAPSSSSRRRPTASHRSSGRNATLSTVRISRIGAVSSSSIRR